MYATATQFLVRYNAEEIAQRADESVPLMVSGEMLKVAAAGGDLSGYTPEEQEATLAALGKVERSLQDAEQTINTYVGTRYQLPLSQAPEVLERIACQVARYVLYDDAMTEQVRQLYTDSVKFLEGIATGKVQLGITDAGSKPAASYTVDMVSDGRVFGRQNSKGYI